VDFGKEASRVVGWIQEVFTLAESIGKISKEQHSILDLLLEFEWGPRMTRTIGMAETGDSLIRIKLSSVLWPLCSEEEKRKTVFHEAAHIVVIIADGADARPHGKEWLSLMSSLGYEDPDIYHHIVSPEVERRIGNKPVYCDCDDSPHTWITPRRKSKITGTGVRCKRCRALVRFHP